MSIRVIALVVAAFAAYLAISQYTVNAVLGYAYVAGILLFMSTRVYLHYSKDADYRFEGRTFWLDIVSIVLIIGVSIQLAGKALTI